jgi:uridine kinase
MNDELGPLLIAPPSYLELRDRLRTALGFPNERKALLIGIDGVDGSGKSALAAWLSWQLEMPVVHLDLYLTPNRNPPEWRTDDLARVIEVQEALERPTIVEGLLLLNVLDAITRKPDVHVFVAKQGRRSGEDYVGAYLNQRKPKEMADYVLEWSSAEHDRRVLEAHLKMLG